MAVAIRFFKMRRLTFIPFGENGAPKGARISHGGLHTGCALVIRHFSFAKVIRTLKCHIPWRVWRMRFNAWRVHF